MNLVPRRRPPIEVEGRRAGAGRHFRCRLDCYLILKPCASARGFFYARQALMLSAQSSVARWASSFAEATPDKMEDKLLLVNDKALRFGAGLFLRLVGTNLSHRPQATRRKKPQDTSYKP